MKVIMLMFMLLYPFIIWGQDESLDEPTFPGDEEDLYSDELAPEEGSPTVKTETDKIHVECVCPNNEMEREVTQEITGSESYMPSIFAPGTAVTIMPTPDKEETTKVEIQTKEYPPGYIEKLPSGYSNDSYKPIGTFEEIKQ